MNTLGKGFIVMAAIAICLSVCGCDEAMPTPAPTPTPAPPTDGLSLEQALADYGVYDVPAAPGDLTASKAVLTTAAAALDMGDTDGFLALLVSDLREDFTPDVLERMDRAGLADALSKAKLVSSREGAIIYSMTLDGKTYQVPMIPEDGTWKIAVL
jgi:hypothetical protein